MGKSLVFFNQHWLQGGAVKGGGGGLTAESEPDYIYIYTAPERETERFNIRKRDRLVCNVNKRDRLVFTVRKRLTIS